MPQSEVTRHLSVDEAWQEMSGRGAIYVDVRSPGEFAGGHPQGAYNVPLFVIDPRSGQLAPNEDFVAICTALIAQHRAPASDASVILGCAAGVRSRQAAELIVAHGVGDLLECVGGWHGAAGFQGWAMSDLPRATVAEDGRNWKRLREDLRAP